ncbi:MAG: hypothetical protein JWL81_2882, partial [Verrucomicrobiales bacterium]|nr:hypothetical protein [Verrucomicrobiales bacterium]
VKDGILTEQLSQTGWDTALFKAAFARGLGALHASLTLTKTEPALATDIARLLEGSATSLLQHSRGPTGEYGLQWQPGAKDQEWNFNTQLAALTELTATLSLASLPQSTPQPAN